MNTRLALPVSLALTIALGAGCANRSAHTRQHASAAKERMGMLKAGTEWQMAEQAFLAGDLEKALTKVDNSLAINDTVTRSYVLKGRILMEMGRMGDAMESLLLGQTYGPQDPEAHYYLAILYERLGEEELALDAYQVACENDDMNPGYAVAAAEMMIDLGREDEAVAFLTSSPTFEHHAGVRQTLGHIAMMDEEYPRAVSFFREAQMLSPDDPAIREDLAFALFESGRFADAEGVLRALMDEDRYEDRRDLRHLLARCFVELGRPVEARTEFQKLTRGNEGSDDVDAWIGLGNAAYMVGDDRTLRNAGGRVMSMAPSAPDGYVLMALYHRRVGSLEDSLANIELALDIDSMDASAHAFRGLVLADLGEMIKSVEAFKISTELAPENPDYRAMLEWARMGDFASAPTDRD
ncbi:MAG: tetratricopeptide repeat protein [Phycisphaerales bacterium JB040]